MMSQNRLVSMRHIVLTFLGLVLLPACGGGNGNKINNVYGKRVDKIEQEYKAAREYFRPEDELMDTLGQEKSLSKDQEAELERLLKREILKKFENYKTTRGFLETFLFYSELMENMPYTWYQNQVASYLWSLKKHYKKMVAEEQPLALKIQDLIQTLDFVKRQMNTLFADQIMTEKRAVALFAS